MVIPQGSIIDDQYIFHRTIFFLISKTFTPVLIFLNM